MKFIPLDRQVMKGGAPFLPSHLRPLLAAPGARRATEPQGNVLPHHLQEPRDLLAVRLARELQPRPARGGRCASAFSIVSTDDMASSHISKPQLKLAPGRCLELDRCLWAPIKRDGLTCQRAELKLVFPREPCVFCCRNLPSNPKTRARVSLPLAAPQESRRFQPT